jgi:electron transport complex protein RnfB
MGRQLEQMAAKGLIYLEGEEETMAVALLPFMPGIYEFNFDKVDAELAGMLKRYMGKYLYPATGRSKAPVGRIIPVGQSLSSQTVVHPYEDVARAIETASSLAVTPCICRTKTRALDQGCEYPLDTCLYLNDYADYLNRVGLGQRLTKKEALDLLEETEEAGLIHLSMNLQETAVICNCCSCCCEGTKALIALAKMEKLDLGPEMNFRLAYDEAACTLCGTCVERCLTNALSLEDDRIDYKPKRCIGCGLCVTHCPEDALCLERKPGEETAPTPKGWPELFAEMGWRESKP